LLALLIAAGIAVQPVPPHAGEAAQKQAQAAVHAFLRRDFKTFTSLTHPRVVQMLGGRERMTEVIIQGLDEMDKEGFAFLDQTVDPALKIVRVGRGLQCLLPVTLKMRAPGGTMTSRSSMLGFSEDDGLTWRFVDAGNEVARSQLKQIFPELSAEIVIPAQEKPVFTPKP
jgi:hypothetical protein